MIDEPSMRVNLGPLALVTRAERGEAAMSISPWGASTRPVTTRVVPSP